MTRSKRKPQRMTSNLLIGFPPEMRERIREAARRSAVSQSAYIRAAVCRALDSEQTQ